jgi:hypothetical protein
MAPACDDYSLYCMVSREIISFITGLPVHVYAGNVQGLCHRIVHRDHVPPESSRGKRGHVPDNRGELPVAGTEETFASVENLSDSGNRYGSTCFELAFVSIESAIISLTSALL